MLVFFHHVGFLTGATYNSRLGDLLDRFDVGVAIFFVLSGFLLSRPYVAAILDSGPLPDRTSFYGRRLRRIVPAYWVALTATYLLLRPESARLADGLDYPLHYLFLQIYPGDTFPKGISPAWTLAVEMTFYVSLPFLAVAGARLVRPLAGPSRRAVALLGVLFAVSVFAYVWQAVILGAGLPTQAVLWLPGMFDQFAVGIAAAVVVVWAERRPLAQGVADALGRHDLLWWLAAAALLVFAASQVGLVPGLERTVWNRELAGHFAYTAVGALALLPVAFGPQDRGVVRRLLQWRPVAAFGVISYGFFLWHVPVIERAIRLTDQEPIFLDWTSRGILSGNILRPTVLAFVLATAAAAASWFLVEKPLIRRRTPREPTPALEQAAP